MPRMIELIRQSAVPSNIMRSAARGALSLPAEDMVEILVCLSTHPVFGEEAKLTLAGWNEASLKAAAANPKAAPEVLDYLSHPKNLRPNLLPALLENEAVPRSRLYELAATGGHLQAATMLASPRIRASADVLRALAENPRVTPEQAREVEQLLQDTEDDPLGVEVAKYLREHADEIKAEEDQPFFLFGWSPEEEAQAIASLPGPDGSAKKPALKKTSAGDNERESVVQKLARLSAGERVLLAMRGNKEERMVLIRDGARVVCNAVLESPKLTDSEIESFAGMKNVNESVLRTISMKRKFLKNYNVIRVLTANPRCPIEVSVGLMPHLLTMDLKYLSINKNVADTVRKLAFKMHRERLVNR